MAALVWAANPNLSADDVWNIIQRTAFHRRGLLLVNAYGAVREALDDCIDVSFVFPKNGEAIDWVLGESYVVVKFNYFSTHPQSGLVRIRCFSDVAGYIGASEFMLTPYLDTAIITETTQVPVILRPGQHTLKAYAYFGEEFHDSDEVSIGVIDRPPEISILQPASGDEFCKGYTVKLRGEAIDPNGTLPESAFSWYSDRDGHLGNGRIITTNKLSVGKHTITLAVVDAANNRTETCTGFTVLAETASPCIDRPPSAVIVSPSNNLRIKGYDYDDERGRYAVVELKADVSDDKDAHSQLKIEWYVKNDNGEELIGTGTTIKVRLYHSTPCRELKSFYFTLKVTDSYGNVSVDTVRVSVSTLC